MYSACIHCNSPLGANESIDTFPVGRRLAFDATKGRLWVVCRSCARWNLTPIEERWEAVEQCERLFRSTRRRVFTENIGLARVADGTELVRIGAALRPELASWRYGRQLIQRHRMARAASAISFAGAVVGTAVLPGYGYVLGMMAASAILAGARWRTLRAEHLRSRSVIVPAAETEAAAAGDVLVKHIGRPEFFPNEAGSWRLRLSYCRGSLDRHDWGVPEINLVGMPAMRALRLILPALNARGGARRTVSAAVELLDDMGTGIDFVDSLSARIERDRFRPRGLRELGAPERLALEMAANEELERQAMAGDLAPLEEAWRQAEEIAAIADDLLFPEPLRRLLSRGRHDD